MRIHCLPSILAVFSILVASGLVQAQLTITPDKPSGIYQIGDNIRWNVQWKGQTPPSGLSYLLKRGALTEIKKAPLTLTGGAAVVETKLDEPGTMVLEVTDDKAAEGTRPMAVGGAVIAPEKIKPATTPPADFDAFWAAKLKELAAVAPHVQLVPVPGKGDTDCWKITLDNIRGTHTQGMLARPKKEGKYPAIIMFHGAGVYGLPKGSVISRANEGWLALDINAHDLPPDQTGAFYKEQSDGPLKNYPSIGNEDRETSYFLRMYLACYQAVQYLADRPDWDGKTLVVTGPSQGGLQSLVAAALNPKVTAAVVNVPAGCDTLGPTIGRKGGWPSWYGSVEGKDAQKVRQTSRYFDVVNFAPRIKCPTLIAMGLLDEVCPPAGILAMSSQLGGPKELVIMPLTGHVGNGSHEAFKTRSEAWLTALRQGKPVPAKP